MFATMKLSKKLSLGFGILIALMMLSGVIAFNALQSLPPIFACNGQRVP